MLVEMLVRGEKRMNERVGEIMNYRLIGWTGGKCDCTRIGTYTLVRFWLWRGRERELRREVNHC